jgi:hypothetical protein
MHSEGYGTLSVCVSLCMSAAILAYRLQVSLQVRKHEKKETTVFKRYAAKKSEKSL